MRRSYFSYLFLAVSFLLTGVTPAASGSIVLKVARIADVRVLTVPNIPQQPMFNPNQPGLTVTLHASGAMADSAVGYGKLTLTKGRDNLGDPLRIAPPSPTDFPAPSGANGMVNIQRQPAGFGPASAGFDVPLHLTDVPRRAMQIAVLRGSFLVIAGGKLRTVGINLMKSRGHEIKSPVLAKAGLQIRLLKTVPAGTFMPGRADRWVILAIKGQSAALRKVKVVNASGGDISARFTTSSEHKGVHIKSYKVRRPFKAGDKVELIVATGQKTIEVPFDFHNIKLP